MSVLVQVLLAINGATSRVRAKCVVPCFLAISGRGSPIDKRFCKVAHGHGNTSEVTNALLNTKTPVLCLRNPHLFDKPKQVLVPLILL